MQNPVVSVADLDYNLVSEGRCFALNLQVTLQALLSQEREQRHYRAECSAKGMGKGLLRPQPAGDTALLRESLNALQTGWVGGCFPLNLQVTQLS